MMQHSSRGLPFLTAQYSRPHPDTVLLALPVKKLFLYKVASSSKVQALNLLTQIGPHVGLISISGRVILLNSHSLCAYSHYSSHHTLVLHMLPQHAITLHRHRDGYCIPLAYVIVMDVRCELV